MIWMTVINPSKLNYSNAPFIIKREAIKLLLVCWKIQEPQVKKEIQEKQPSHDPDEWLENLKLEKSASTELW